MPAYSGNLLGDSSSAPHGYTSFCVSEESFQYFTIKLKTKSKLFLLSSSGKNNCIFIRFRWITDANYLRGQKD